MSSPTVLHGRVLSGSTRSSRAAQIPEHSPIVCVSSDLSITESFRLEKTSKIIESSCSAATHTAHKSPQLQYFSQY